MNIVNNKIQFDEDDVFDLDTTFAEIIHTGLIKFKEGPRNSIPPQFFKRQDNITHDDEQAAGILWEQVIDEMIFAFSNIDLIDEYEKITGTPYDYTKECFDENNVFKPYVKAGYTTQMIEEWQKNRAKWEASMNERIQYGRQLFIKFFDNLWI